MSMEIIPIGPAHRAFLAEHLREGWGGAVIITRGRAVDASRLPGLLCMEAGQVLGVATFEITGDACELVTLDSLRGGLGIGTRLLEQGTEIPRGSGAGFLLVARSRSAGVAAPRQT